ncbi:hypothetical protein HY636_05870 [Candidatus Woesearchaeota archaeon]|nr:hypothetical protein [Candidatus Woesearchaeota archaeon]
MKSKLKYFVIVLLAAVILIVAGCSSKQDSGNTNNENVVKNVNSDGSKITVELYRSESCGCCVLYSEYIVDNGFDLDLKEVDDISTIKEKYNIPETLQSCHTSIIDGYFVEGHVPIEAINKLLTEKPQIKGIALPGMPSASPGMPGGKNGDFVVYKVNNDGSIEEFMKI